MQVNRTNNVSFKAHYVNVDIGASSINGSMKIKILNEAGNIIDYTKTTVFKEGTSRSENKFEKSVAENIVELTKNNRNKILIEDPDDEMFLTVCYPGPKTSENGKAGFRLTNFYYDNNRQHRFDSTISPENIDKYIVSRGINLVQSRHANDMSGAGACILNKVQKDCSELLKEGEDILFLYPGGGLGSGIISVDKNNIKIRPAEIQHVRKNGPLDIDLEHDAGAPGIVSNFAQALGLTEQERQALGNEVRLVANYEMAKEYLPSLTPEKHTEAARHSMDKFVDSLAEITAMQIASFGTKSVVLTGNIINTISTAINKENIFTPKSKYMKDECDRFTAFLREKIDEKLTPFGKVILGEPSNLKVKLLQIKDNTDGAELLQKCEEVGNPTKWYNYISTK